MDCRTCTNCNREFGLDFFQAKRGHRLTRQCLNCRNHNPVAKAVRIRQRVGPLSFYEYVAACD